MTSVYCKAALVVNQSGSSVSQVSTRRIHSLLEGESWRCVQGNSRDILTAYCDDLALSKVHNYFRAPHGNSPHLLREAYMAHAQLIIPDALNR